MVLLLNYFQYIILVIGIYIGYRQIVSYNKNKNINNIDDESHKLIKNLVFTVLITIASVIMFTALTNSYIGKSIDSKTTVPIPPFEVNNDTIVNRFREPDVLTDEEFNEMVKWDKGQ